MSTPPPDAGARPASLPPDMPERLFSYGTLQQDDVQQATFGRRLSGHADRLPGHRLVMLEIRDPAVVAASGKRHHPMAVWTGHAGDVVQGRVLEISASELAQADRYEVADYRRDRVTLASGAQAWAYVDARQPRRDGA